MNKNKLKDLKFKENINHSEFFEKWNTFVDSEDCENMMKLKVGIVFGSMSPMHNGHEALIDCALSENDKVVVSLDSFRSQRTEDNPMPLCERVEAIEKFYKDNNKVLVQSFVLDYITGSDRTKYWDIWSEKMLSELLKTLNIENFNDISLLFYTGDEMYLEHLERVLGSHKIRYIDRNSGYYTPVISGTEIRNNPKKYWHNINDEFKKFFKLKGETEDEKI